MVRINFNRLRFLVIDDNAYMRRILRTLLHGFGTREVYEAEDGAAGLEAFTHYMPDIVLTDWVMPIFDGLELAQMIRQPGANANPYVPIIMLSGHSEKKRVVSARDAGITEFLAKPISAKALYERILNVVANPRPFIKTKTYFGPDRRRIVNPNYVGRSGARRQDGCDPPAAAARQSRELSARSNKKNGRQKGHHAVGRNVRGPRGDHASQRAPQGAGAGNRSGRRPGGARRSRTGAAFRRIAGWMNAECERLEAARQQVKLLGFTEKTHEELFRASHDIKGEAVTFGFPGSPTSPKACGDFSNRRPT